MKKHRQFTIATFISLLLLAVISGCSEEETVRMLNKETYAFNGVFDNPYNSDLLKFKDAQVTIITQNGMDVTKPFTVEDQHVIIQMRNSSKEKRENIIMRIHGESEVLTCSVCAKYQLAATWRKQDFVPSSSQ